MEPSEVEFLAEKEIVTVIPNFSENKIALISGDYGPFNPSMPVEVPLWLAVNLKQRQRCHIQPPQWLNVAVLSEKKHAETTSELFVEMPSKYYLEVATLLLNNAADDISQADEIRTLIKDIWDIRTAKLRRSMDQMMSKQATHGKVDNLTLMEINSIRPFLTSSLEQLHILKSHVEEYTAPDDSTF